MRLNAVATWCLVPVVAYGCAEHSLGDPAGGDCLFCKQPLTFERDGKPLDCCAAASNHFLFPERLKHPVRVGGGFPAVTASAPFTTSTSSLQSLPSFCCPTLMSFSCCPNLPGFHLPLDSRDFCITGVMNITWSGTLKAASLDEVSTTRRRLGNVKEMSKELMQNASWTNALFTFRLTA